MASIWAMLPLSLTQNPDMITVPTPAFTLTALAAGYNSLDDCWRFGGCSQKQQITHQKDQH